MLPLVLIGAILSCLSTGLIAQEEPAEITMVRPAMIVGTISESPLFDSQVQQGLSIIRATYIDAAIGGNNALHPGSIDIVIKSTGGQLSGLYFAILAGIEAVVAQGGTVRCVVDQYANSAAAALFARCSERYMTEGSVVTLHTVQPLGEPTVLQRLQIAAMDDVLWKPVKLLITEPAYFQAAKDGQVPQTIEMLQKHAPKLNVKRAKLKIILD